MVKRTLKKTKSKKRRFQRRKGVVKVISQPQQAPIINIYGMPGPLRERPEPPSQQQAVTQIAAQAAAPMRMPMPMTPMLGALLGQAPTGSDPLPMPMRPLTPARTAPKCSICLSRGITATDHNAGNKRFHPQSDVETG